jgi:hypothetical protein
MHSKTLLRVAGAAVAVLLITSYASPLRALPGSEIHRIYYVGCTSLTEVGTYDIYCDSGPYIDGQQSGDWREIYSTDCQTLDSTYTVQEWCTNHWRNADFLGDCRCDHP